MTTNKDSNPPKRTSVPDRPDGEPQAHERLDSRGYKTADQLNPRNDRGQGDEREQAQGRGNDPDKG